MRVVGQMENGAIMKPPHYSLSALSSIRKINISTIPLGTKSQENERELEYQWFTTYQVEISGILHVECTKRLSNLGQSAQHWP